MNRPLVSLLLASLIVLSISESAYAQVSPADHAKHHPAPAVQAPAPGALPAMGANPRGAAAAPPAGASGMGGMMEGMGEMMKGMGGMGGTPPKALYPSLMDLPDMPPEERDEVLRAAHERMKSGADLMAQGLDQLVQAAPTNDYAAMQAATALLREGVARFDSGIAANRAIAEGHDPRALATQWFKGQMNLRTTAMAAEASGPLGLTWSHLFIMLLLVGFAAVMIAMYFFKMRRAAALFGRIEGDKGSPPPGSAPPLAGKPGPGAPVGPPGTKTPPREEKKSAGDGKASTPEGTTPPAAAMPAATDGAATPKSASEGA